MLLKSGTVPEFQGPLRPMGRGKNTLSAGAEDGLNKDMQFGDMLLIEGTLLLLERLNFRRWS